MAGTAGTASWLINKFRFEFDRSMLTNVVLFWLLGSLYGRPTPVLVLRPLSKRQESS